MPYITRDKKGAIIAIYNDEGDDRQWEEPNIPDVIAYIKKMDPSHIAKQVLTESDNDMVRVIEDLIELLMEKQVFVYTELPEAVQEKLTARKQLRQKMNSLANLINEDDNIF
jgi:hypothetical protein